MLTFLGIGAQKAGTTWLYEILNTHPEVSFPLGKETHFWNKHFNGKNAADYLAAFNSPTLKEGEITPAYGHLPPAKIAQIAKYVPDLRLIYILRNPIDRAWSSALMALNRAEMKYSEASDQWFMDHFKSSGSLNRSNYERNIHNWRNHFPDHSFLILFFEDISSHPQNLIKQCLAHIGVINSSDFFEDSILTKKVFSSRPISIRPELHSYLRQLYTTQIESLEFYLDKELPNWRKIPME